MTHLRPPGGPHVRSYSWERLEKTDRARESAARVARRWATTRWAPTSFAAALREILRADVRIAATQTSVPGEGRFSAGVTLLFASEDCDERPIATVQAELSLVLSAVARALNRTPKALVVAGQPPTDALVGAFAAVCVAALRRAGAPMGARLLSAGPTREEGAAPPEMAAAPAAFSLSVSIDGEVHSARATVVGLRESAHDPPWNRAALARLGDLPLGLPIVACEREMTGVELAALRVGDVLIPGGWALALSPSGELCGPVHLAAEGDATGMPGRLAGNGSLVLGGDAERFNEAEGAMPDSVGVDAIAVAVGEVPVLVRVEIGEARMTAREWAGLTRGDVVALGRRVGERVVLRIAGAIVARGELVDIDGELGVRIAERVPEEATAW